MSDSLQQPKDRPDKMQQATLENSNSQIKPPSNLAILLRLISAPAKAFEAISLAYPLALPFLMILIFNALFTYLAFSSLDYSWYVDNWVEQAAADLSKAEKNQIRQGMTILGGVSGLLKAFIAAMVSTVLMCLFCLYFVVVSAIRGDGFRFSQWFSLVSWSMLPSIIGVLASIIAVVANQDGQYFPEIINPLSLNNLIFSLNPFTGLGSILASIDLSSFWTLALLTIGYSQWTRSSYLLSSVIILIPYLLIFGVSAIF